MIQIPKDILLQCTSVKVKNIEMYGISFRNNPAYKDSDVLQTSHCLEVTLTGKAEVRQGEIIQHLEPEVIQFRKRGTYRITCSEDYTSLMFFLENEFIEDFLKQHIVNYSSQSGRLFEGYDRDSFPPDLPPFLFRSNELIRGSIFQAMHSINVPGTFSSCLVKISAHQLLLQLLSMDRTHAYVNFLKYLISHRKTDLAYFMETNFRQQMSLKEMARLTGRSESGFKKDFNALFHDSPFRWLLNRRLDYARNLIRHSGTSVSDAAFQSGFENLSHFSRSYKNKFGHAPAQEKNER